MPGQVRIAGGLQDGVYNTISTSIADALTANHGVGTFVIPSGGSLDNQRRLRDAEVDLAPMQASAINGGHLCVVSPLFYEAVHVLVRDGSGIVRVEDLPGHRVAVGPKGSGSRLAAELVFDSLGFSPDDCPREVIAWADLQLDTAPDAAVVCIGKGSKMVSDLLESKRWRLVPITDGIQIALDHPTLQPMTIKSAEYPGGHLIPATGITTVGTTAFLAARVDAPSQMIDGVLDSLYRNESAADRFGNIALIPRQQVAEWQGLNFHPAARKFFAESE